MATVRLHDVSKVYLENTAIRHHQMASGRKGADRAFAECSDALARQTYEQWTTPDQAVIALDHVNLTVLNGQIMAVIGPSGCGKSTLLRVVAGLEEDYTGQVLYDGRDMRDIPPRDRYIGMVFQNYALYPHFEGWGNLAFFFKLHKVSDEETAQRIRFTSEIMGIGFNELLKRKPGTLSSGQQQRVAIARAIVRNPRLFLFDEPLSNLDAQLRMQTRGEIKRLLDQFHITSIYVTHDQTEAIALADRLAMMRDGKIEQIGTYQTLRQNPVNAFVAGFLGNPPMNLLTGSIVNNTSLHLNGFAIPLPPLVKAQVRPGQRVTLGIRPEAALLVTGNQPTPEGPRLAGVIELIEPDFAHQQQLVHVRTGQLVYAVVGKRDDPVHLGDQVEVIFPGNELYFFDGNREHRIV
ncbi:MAG: ABC transporter ATP-binding protein [Anaerolineae bacterium]|nr:ABC transporter ATP-binding protein [Anaerolineae bacterium]